MSAFGSQVVTLDAPKYGQWRTEANSGSGPYEYTAIHVQHLNLSVTLNSSSASSAVHSAQILSARTFRQPSPLISK
ncbi:hypothetical protein IAS59_001067 [Cryptococcus gattii]